MTAEPRATGNGDVGDHITERKRAEDSLKLLRTLIDQSNDAIEVIDPETFRFLDCNESAHGILGYSREEFLTLSVFDIDPLVDRESIQRFDDELRKSGFATLESIHRRKDGSTFPVEVNVKVVRLERDYRLAVVRDISGRKRDEAALRLAEQKYRQIFENAGEGIFQSTAEGRLLTANPALARMLGYDSAAELIVKRNDIERQHYVDPLRRQELKRLVEANGFIRGFEYEAYKKDGSKLWMTGNVRAVREEDGTFLYYEGTAQDINERKRAEAKSAAFATLARKLSGARTQLDAGRIIAQTAGDLFGWDSCDLNLYDADRDLIHHILSVDTIDGRQTDVTVSISGREPTARGRRVIAHGPELRLREEPVQFDADTIPFGDKTRPSASIMTVPVRHAARVVGLLSVQSYTPHNYDGAALADLEALADHCGEALNRIRAEESLSASEERYRELFENAKDVNYVHDLSGRYISVNRAAEKLSGYTREEILGKHYSNFVTPSHLPYVRKNLSEKVDEESETIYEVLVITKDRRRVPVELSSRLIYENGVVVAVQGTARDITERKRAENALQESEERFRQLSEAAFEAIILHDQGTILEVNQSFCRMYGYERAEVIGKSVLDLAPPEFRELLQQKLLAGDTDPYEGLALRKDGTIFRAELAGKPIHYQGRVVRVAAIRDITEQKRNERRQAAQYAVTRVLAESATLAEATPQLLQVICESLRWKMGEFWRVRDSTNLLRCVETWHVPALDATSFIEASRQTELAPGAGLPGRVWQSGQPAWTPDVMTDPSFARAAIAAKVGLRGAVAFPILLGNHTLGVMLFFSRRAPEVDEDLLKIMSAIGSQIGQFTERKRAEEALLASERKYHDIFTFAPVGIYQSLRDGTLITANKALAEMLGYDSVDELLRVKLGSGMYLSEDQRQRLIREHEVRGYPVDLELQWKTKDGSPIWIQLSAHAIKVANGVTEYWEGFVRDITDRKRVEEALRESEERYRDLVENSREFICTHDLDGVILSANRAAVEILGYDPKDYTGKKSFRDLLVPEVRDQFDDYLARIRRDGFASGLTVVQTSSGKRRVWEYYNTLRTEGVATPIVRGMAHDITDRREAEKALRVSEQKYRDIFSFAPVGICQTLRDGTLITANTALATMLGYDSVDELLQLKLDSDIYFVAGEREEVITTHENRGYAIDLELQWKRKDGSPFWVQLNAHTIKGHGGAREYFEGFVLDITGRKRSEESLRKQNEYLAALHETALGLINRLDLNELLEDIVTRALALVDIPGGHVYLVEPSGTEMRVKVGVGVSRDFVGARISKGQGVAGRIWQTGQPLVVDDYRNWEHRLPDAGYDVLRLVAAVPLRSDSRVVGVLGVESTEDGQGLDKHQIEILNRFAQLASIALDNAQLHSAVQQELAERKRAEEVLREREARLSAIYRAAPVGIGVDVNRVIQEVNDTLCRITGYSREELIGQNSRFLFMTQEDYDRVGREKYRVVAEHLPKSIMARLRQKDGRIIDVLFSAVLLDAADLGQGVTFTVQDITESKQVEEALREAEQKYRELFENAKDAIYVHDLTGRYTSVNPAAEALSGYPRDEILGKHFTDFIAPEYLGPAQDSLCRKLKESGETSYEAEVITRDGRRVPVEINSRLIRRNGEVVGVQGAARDITERKRAQEAMRSYSRRLMEVQEAERQSIARELHDEIGQVLTAVRINLQSAQRSSGTEAYSLRIEDSIVVVDEALTRVRELSLQLRPSLLDDLGLTAALRWYADRYALRTGFTVQILSDCETVRLRRELETACFRIAQEALTNIARYTEATRVLVELKRAKDILTLVIKDDGPGFDVDALFRNAAAGAALGLRGMEERALAVEGRFRITSAPGQGTEVRVTFPLTRKG